MPRIDVAGWRLESYSRGWQIGQVSEDGDRVEWTYYPARLELALGKMFEVLARNAEVEGEGTEAIRSLAARVEEIRAEIHALFGEAASQLLREAATGGDS